MSRPERGWAYAAVSVLFISVMMATTEPTPLYAFWERSYGFGSVVTTLVFATYAVGVIGALLFAGRDSDVDGRRPVLIACTGLSALSSVLFLVGNGSPRCSRRGWCPASRPGWRPRRRPRPWSTWRARRRCGAGIGPVLGGLCRCCSGWRY